MSPAETLEKSFPFTPTAGQKSFFHSFASFLQADSAKPVFILKGYAGTGKTTLLATLVKVSGKFDYKNVLLAPTGRAAKVMASYSGRQAFTIHKHIYIREDSDDTLFPKFRLRNNQQSGTIFIVDEASMISGGEGENNQVLNDLFRFVFRKKNNRLLFVGDTAQLPPVRQESSPALSGSFLEERFAAAVTEHELVEVLRQKQRSGILENATQLRDNIRTGKPSVSFNVRGFRDIYRMTSEKLEDGLRYAYDKYGRVNTTIICRSNRSATMFNRFIRFNIDMAEDEVSAGDFLMVVKNNYDILDPESGAGFLANGDFVEVQNVKRYEEAHGFRFADMELKLVDYPNEPSFEAKVLLDVLHSFTPSMAGEDQKKLYDSVVRDYRNISPKKEQLTQIRKDPYLKSLQVKFAYALTCHKSQGGQWDAVFLEQGYIPDNTPDTDYLRWLYTAVTRCREELFLVNFSPDYFL